MREKLLIPLIYRVRVSVFACVNLIGLIDLIELMHVDLIH